MKNIIITVSVHHGNTRKVVDAIAKEFNVEVVDAVSVKEKDLRDYDLIGFASGVYGFNWHKEIIRFAEKNLPEDKKIFLISTSAMNKDFSASFMKSIADKKPEVVGRYSCTGYNTFGPFKLVGGSGKGHPNAVDLKNAVAFYRDLVRE